MTEFPSAKPTADVTWATSGGASKTEPGGALRAAGYVNLDPVAHDHFNWLLSALGAALDWVRAAAVRAFDNPYDAFVATTAGQAFVLRAAQKAGMALATIKAVAATGSLSDSLPCTDGARLFYRRGQVLYCVANTLSVDAEVISSFALDDSPAALCAHTDGALVAYGMSGSSGGKSVQIWSVSAAGVLASLYSADGFLNVAAILCDYGAANVADAAVVWWGRSDGAIYSWSVAQGAVAVTGTHTGAIAALDSTWRLLFVATSSGRLRAYGKIDSVPVNGDPLTDYLHREYIDLSLSPRACSLCNDGEVVYFAIDGTGSGTSDTASIQIHAHDIHGGVLQWSKYTNISATAAQRIKISCDDRYLYCSWSITTDNVGVGVFNKRTGAMVYYYGDGAALLSPVADGLSVWVLNASGSGGLLRLSTARESSMWMRSQPQDGRRYKRLVAPDTST